MEATPSEADIIIIINLLGLRQKLIDGVRGYLSLILERVIEENRFAIVIVEWVIEMGVGWGEAAGI